MSRYCKVWLAVYISASLLTIWQAPSMDHHWPILVGLLPGLIALPLGPLASLVSSALLFEVFRWLGAPLGVEVQTGVLSPLPAQVLLVALVIGVTGWVGYLQWFVWLPRLLSRARPDL